ncbi:glycosyltransferase [uncultured Polaribacter sp.]|uniref:glycosyltransferase n=1 Tax=uncultured Polaribacter sp. TaxID=174711 RepID=UPI002634461C|nr:glycosyltransferase [uncultured Polaribacter sp.]
MIYLLIFLYVLYAVLIISLAIGFTRVKEFTYKTSTQFTKFTVIIPFRNESEKLPLLLNSILELNYNLEFVEFLFIDDASSDNSTEIVANTLKETGINYTILKNKRVSNSPKKDAITSAIAVAKNNWIVTTDADCILPKEWLKVFSCFIKEKQPKMVVAPVNYIVKNTSLEQFQLLDFMSLQATTIGGFGIGFPFLCNGANLAYRKDVFLELDGFKGNTKIASGDDIFLFEKFKQVYKKKVQFLKSKDAMVTTFPVTTNSDLINQRVRWASKTSNLKSIFVKLIGLLIFLINLSVVLSIFLSNNLLFILTPIFVKICIDILLFLPAMNFYSHKKSFYKWYPFSSILYPFFSVFIVFKSLFYKYNWKGRTFKK